MAEMEWECGWDEREGGGRRGEGKSKRELNRYQRLLRRVDLRENRYENEHPPHSIGDECGYLHLPNPFSMTQCFSVTSSSLAIQISHARLLLAHILIPSIPSIRSPFPLP